MSTVDADGVEFATTPLLIAPDSFTATELVFTLPANLPGQEQGALPCSVQVRNSDASFSGALNLLVSFRAWCSVSRVAGAVPGFARGGVIADRQILGWITDVGQAIRGAMLGRGYSLNPTDWQQPQAGSNDPEPADILEGINMLGAAAMLAAQIASQFSSGQFALQTSLEKRYTGALAMLRDGAYDKIFKPLTAVTAETGVQAGGGDMTNPDTGEADIAFTKDQVF